MQQPSEKDVAMAGEPAEVIEEESLIEEVSIDGMCGVY
jgi:mycofactocin precursor